jgi:hypothetical protein
MMDKTLQILGSIVGATGILICLLAGINRLTGGHWILGFETITLFTGGTALMIAGCLAKLHALALQLRS